MKLLSKLKTVNGIYVVAALTAILFFAAIRVSPAKHALRSSLLINLLASGITIVFTSLFVDANNRRRLRQDSRPALIRAQRELHEEIEYFFGSVSYYYRDAQGIESQPDDRGPATLTPRQSIDYLNHTRYLKGKRLLKSVTTKELAGKKKVIGYTAIENASRVAGALKEILGNYSFGLSHTNQLRLFEIKDSLVTTSKYLQQELGGNSLAGGYYSEDEGFVSNEDYAGNLMSSMEAYYVMRLIKLCRECDEFKFQPPVL